MDQVAGTPRRIHKASYRARGTARRRSRVPHLPFWKDQQLLSRASRRPQRAGPNRPGALTARARCRRSSAELRPQGTAQPGRERGGGGGRRSSHGGRGRARLCPRGVRACAARGPGLQPLLIVYLEPGCFPLAAPGSRPQPGWPSPSRHGPAAGSRALARSQHGALQVGVSAAPGDPPTGPTYRRLLIKPSSPCSSSSPRKHRSALRPHGGNVDSESLDVCQCSFPNHQTPGLDLD